MNFHQILSQDPQDFLIVLTTFAFNQIRTCDYLKKTQGISDFPERQLPYEQIIFPQMKIVILVKKLFLTKLM